MCCCAVACAYPDRPPYDAGVAATRSLTASPAEIDLGILAAGSTRPFAFTLTNATAEPAVVVRVSTSCDCVIVTLPAGTAIPAGRSVRVQGAVDLSHDPLARGSLQVTVTGEAATAGPFAVAVLFDVRPGDSEVAP